MSEPNVESKSRLVYMASIVILAASVLCVIVGVVIVSRPVESAFEVSVESVTYLPLNRTFSNLKADLVLYFRDSQGFWIYGLRLAEYRQTWFESELFNGDKLTLDVNVTSNDFLPSGYKIAFSLLAKNHERTSLVEVPFSVTIP